MIAMGEGNRSMGAAARNYGAFDARRSAIYVPMVLEQMPRLLACLDREPHSLSYGNFDRMHWGWKFCDFPLGMAQIAAYPVAILWRHGFAGNPYYQNARVLAWLHGVVEYVCRQQRRNGSFDSVGPYTQDHGNSLYMAYLLTEVRELLGSALDAGLEKAASKTAIAAAHFGLQSGEDYAFISNHQATYALAFHNVAQLSGDARFAARAKQNIRSILRNQSPEGWYLEYGGADPGYESLGIFYLATYWRRTGDTELLDSLRRSVEFLSHFIHPDGSVGGGYGSRHTSLYMPGGLELLAPEVPAAAAAARFLRERFSRGNLITPMNCDAQNLAVLAYTYLGGCFAPTQKAESTMPLPCESLMGVRRFPLSGLTVAGTPAYYAIANASKGGVCRVFDRQRARLTYEDAGYVVDTGHKRYSSQLAGLSHEVPHSDANEVVSDATFGEVRQELPTAAKWIVLRSLNLTLFRSLTMGAWVRRQILQRLILARHAGPFRLVRSILFGESEILFRDTLTVNGRTRVKSVELARSFTPIHMGSAKYFHASDLEETPLPPHEDTAGRLNGEGSATREFTVRFPLETSASGVQLEVSTLP